MRLFVFVLISVLSFSLFADWSVTGDLTHYNVMNRGDRITREILITNHGNEKLTLNIKQADYAYNAEGNIWFIEPGKLSRSNANWISFATQEINIAAKSKVNFSYSVKVPENEDLIGSYWSILFIEEGGLGYEVAKNNELKLQVNQRYAIQSITQIGDTGQYNILFEGAEFKKSTNELILNIKNTGERWANPNVWVELYDSDGTKVGVFNANKHKLYPQTSHAYKIPLVSLNKKNYYVVGVVDCGENKVFGSQFNIQN
ncbi:MAG TPA: hypothetical protein PKZ69_04700 [Candidatus Cloacimonadota bacterium]|nr:hypothetical protein [Candidatus Cloacimonadota bacterium]HOQ80559.1 hypothetical protein [Candidatus Cloacimonadota bacterium]HPK40902.1 hypothetical protein [Candidatus Cloacimonadota bacterium]